MLLRGDMTKRAETWPKIGWWWHHPVMTIGRVEVWVCSPTKLNSTFKKRKNRALLTLRRSQKRYEIRAIIGDGDRKRAPFLVLGLAPWYGTIFLFLEQIAPPPAAHARTCCEDFYGCRAGEMASEIHEIFYAFGPQLNTFMSVGIWLKHGAIL